MIVPAWGKIGDGVKKEIAMIITLEEKEIDLLVRKAIERNDVPVPEGYVVVGTTTIYNEDTGRTEVDIHLELEGVREGLIKANG